jgi:hypothetical protein
MSQISQRCEFLNKWRVSARIFLLWVVAVIAPGSGVAGEEGSLLWEADFSRVETGPAPAFGTNVAIREENGIKVLSKVDSQTDFLLAKDLQKIPESSRWIDYVFKVRYRETEKSTLSLVVKARGSRPDVPYLHYYVRVGPDGISVLCHGLPKEASDAHKDDPRRTHRISYEEMGASVLPVGEWITAEVEVGDEVIRVSVDAGDHQPRNAEFKVFSGTGQVSLLARSPIDVQYASVRAASDPVIPQS